MELTREITQNWTDNDWLKWYKYNSQVEDLSPMLIQPGEEQHYEEIAEMVSKTQFTFNPEQADKTLVTLLNNKPIGYLEIGLYEHDYDKRGNFELIRLIITHPDHKQSGIASKLLEYLIKPEGKYQANIHLDNTPSRNLFKKHEFIEGTPIKGLVPAFYGFDSF